MINCIAIDDEPLALELLKNYIARQSVCRLVQTFTDAVTAKKYLEEHDDIQLIFLDIQMPDITGIHLYNSLTVKPLVIFTTAFSEHAVAGFELDAVDYLLKPFSYERFEKSVTRAGDFLKYQQGKSSDSIQVLYIKSDYKIVRILCNDIIYIESVDDYVKIYRQNDKPILTLMSLKTMLSKLPATSFIRIHRRYIAAINKITSFTTKKIMIETIELPIGERFAEQVKLITS